MRIIMSLIALMTLTEGVSAISLVERTLHRLQVLDIQEAESISGLLNEMLSGPLKEEEVIILLQEDARSNNFLSEDILERIDSSFLLLKFAREEPKAMLHKGNISQEVLQAFGSYQTQGFPMITSVMVIVMAWDEPNWWPLRMPPEDWAPKGIVLISPYASCLRDSYLATPLLGKSSSLAVLCPYKTQGVPQTKTPFKIWTSMPLASQENYLVDLGTWSPMSFASWVNLFIDRFKDMSRKNMTIISLPQDRPLIYYFDGILKGTNYYLLDALSSWLHFKLSYILEGYVDWSLILSEVKRGNSDVFINYGIMTPQRYEEFDFTVPYHEEGYGIVVEVPPPLPRWQNVIFPFTGEVWGLTVLALICTSVTYHVMNYKNEDSFLTNTVIVMQSLLSEPIGTVPKVWRLRNFLVVWWLVSWFINMSYMSNLIAVLTAPAFPKRMKTAQDLVDSDYRLCMVDFGDFVDEALAESDHPVMSALDKILDMVPSYVDWEHIGEEQCIELVIAGTHAHTDTYSYTVTLYSILGHGQQIYSLKEQLYPYYLALIVKKYNPWKYKFDQGMQWMIEAGIMAKWEKDGMADFDAYNREERIPELQPLSLSHLQGAFYIYAFGHIIGSLTIAWELLIGSSLSRSQ